MRKWTPEQQELFEFQAGQLKLPRVAVSADAGSGKTSTLVERIKVILDEEHKNQRALLDTFKILCVSFTERSKADLEERLFQYPECEIYTIHGFCARIVKEFGSRVGIAPEFKVLDAEENDELLYEAFMKVYRRSPLPSSVHAPAVYYEAVTAYVEKRITSEQAFAVNMNTKEDWQKFFEDVFFEYTSLKEQQKKLSYSDLEWFAYQILKSKEVQHTYLKRYQHVFVDEFQDTSEMQASIVRMLTGKEKPLFIVGDEKQSIYRFRGADVEVFKAFSKEIREHRRLSYNFRSLPDIIHAVNAVCEPVLQQYSEMQCGLESAESSGIAKKVLCASDVQGIVSAIEEIEASGGSRSQTVLLLRKLSGKKNLFEALKERGVTVSFAGTSGSHVREEFLELINLWIAVTQPWRTLAKIRTLLTFENEMSLERQKILETNADVFETFRKKLPLLNADELLQALDTELRLQQRYAQIFEEFKLYILQHANLNCRPQVMASRFHAMMQTGERWKNLIHFPPPPELEGTLRVMTIHSSKGLEFENVILADLSSRPPNAKPWLLQNRTLYFSERDDEGNILRGDAFKNALIKEQEDELQESSRLLYVAMTRAKSRLFAVLPENQRKSKVPRWSDWLDAGLKATLQTTAQQNVELKTTSKIITELHETPIELPHVTYRKSRTGVLDFLNSQTKSPETHQEISQTATAEPATSKSTLNFAEIGTRVHRYLQLEAWDDLKIYAKKNELDLGPFFSWLETEEGCTFFPQKNIRDVEVLKEFAFDWRMNNQNTLTGRVDRLILQKSKKQAWIIDFKTLFSKKTPEKFIETYREQLKLYEQAVATLDSTLSTQVFLIDVCARTGKVVHKLSL